MITAARSEDRPSDPGCHELTEDRVFLKKKNRKMKRVLEKKGRGAGPQEFFSSVPINPCNPDHTETPRGRQIKVRIRKSNAIESAAVYGS